MIIELLLFLVVVALAVGDYMLFKLLPPEEQAQIEKTFTPDESKLLKWEPPKTDEEIASEQVINKIKK
jgi:hypothetical protein